MINIVLITITCLMLLLGTLMSFVPNFRKIANDHLIAQGFQYATYRTLEEAQLANRAGRLTSRGGAWTVNSDLPLFLDGKKDVFLEGAARKDSFGKIVVEINKK